MHGKSGKEVEENDSYLDGWVGSSAWVSIWTHHELIGLCCVSHCKENERSGAKRVSHMTCTECRRYPFLAVTVSGQKQLTADWYSGVSFCSLIRCPSRMYMALLVCLKSSRY